ncbi:MAG: riboflavin synthase, partial [Terriglobia bacterium]
IRKPRGWKLRPDESVCVEGVCSTVQKAANGAFHVTYMPETLRCTTLRRVVAGNRVNLERSLTLASLLGGHLVQGHVDTTARLVGICSEGEARIYEFSLPARYSRYIVEKGSIAVDGISLTVVEARRGRFSTSLLAYTLSRTTLGRKVPGEFVNVEVDILAKYVEKLTSR